MRAGATGSANDPRRETAEHRLRALGRMLCNNPGGGVSTRADLDTEIAAYDEQRATLEANHRLKWVVFHDRDLIGLYDSFNSAAQDAVRRFGRGPYLIRQVGALPLSLPASVWHHSL